MIVLWGTYEEIGAGDTSVIVFGQRLWRWRRIDRRRWHNGYPRAFANPDAEPYANTSTRAYSHANPYTDAHAASFLRSDRCRRQLVDHAR